MTNENDLLHERINIRGEIENIRAVLGEREKFDNERDRLYLERFQSQEKALQLKAEELSRRLDVLNHAHEQAREKERDFISREVYEKQVERNQDDMKALSVEIKTAAEPVASALVDQDRRNNERFVKVENFQNKLTGALILVTFLVPTLSAILTYLVTH